MRFLIDANLPYRFELWRGPEFTHVFDLDDTWTDSRIWRHARDNDRNMHKPFAVSVFEWPSRFHPRPEQCAELCAPISRVVVKVVNGSKGWYERTG